MHEDLEAFPQGAQQRIQQSPSELHHPGIDGVYQAKNAPCFGCGGLEQRLGIVVAADDPVQGHDVRRRHLGGQVHEIPVKMPDSPRQAQPLRFPLRGLQVPGGGVDVDSLARPSRQEPVMDRSEAASDIQDGEPAHPFCGNTFD
jgi:hypothetical protein